MKVIDYGDSGKVNTPDLVPAMLHEISQPLTTMTFVILRDPEIWESDLGIAWSLEEYDRGFELGRISRPALKTAQAMRRERRPPPQPALDSRLDAAENFHSIVFRSHVR